MIKQVVIEWNYEPKDFFEARIVIECYDFEIVVDSGLAVARLGPEYLDIIDSMISELTENLESRFLAVQVMTHVTYKLSKPTRYDLRENGTKNIYLQVDSFVSIASIVTVDLVIRDADGNIVSDTKQERVNKKKWFAESASKFRARDKILDQMLKSYSASVSDPKNELVHLYEIRDSASTRFRNDSKAKIILNITRDEWNTLGRLANNEPLKQGRHRGQNPGALRDAERSELEQARKIAAKIVENYMSYLEKEES